jgi:hypothetical protein
MVSQGSPGELGKPARSDIRQAIQTAGQQIGAPFPLLGTSLLALFFFTSERTPEERIYFFFFSSSKGFGPPVRHQRLSESVGAA